MLSQWTPWPWFLANLLTSALWIAALVMVVRRHRSGVKATAKDYASLAISVWFAGVFVPIGPVWWWLDYWQTRDHPVPGRPVSFKKRALA